ncbi:acyl-CoA dehydrogenase family protein [Qipengyuania sp. RANM35]|uniref:acyl-CoA dehydrogenase family protein n=1 Tax=Qipengyuania sp. RANM35 TaxID=3068635 RepID=UPI0034DAD5C5
MDLQLDDQQKLLQQSLARFLEKRLPFDVRQRQRSASDFLEFWRALDSELGVGAAGIDEDLGGFGGGREAEMIVATALGGALAVTPYVASNVLSSTLLSALGQNELAGAIGSGNAIVTTAVEEAQTRGDVALIEARAEPVEKGWRFTGKKLAVDFASVADVVLVPARLADGNLALFASTPAELGAALKSYHLVDGTPAADIVLDGLVLPGSACLAKGEAVLAALSLAVDAAIAAYCGEAAGIASVMVEDTVAYTKERQQFGVAIASFQALQHRMVDMWAKAREIEAASLLATLKSDRPDAVSAAKATVSDGLRLIGQEAVQLHGAMGLTEELRVGHYFKRATVLEHRLGSAADHVERYRALRSHA